MSTRDQNERWQKQVLELVGSGISNVDTIITKRHGARMSTLIAIKQLCAAGKLIRAGNSIWKPKALPF